MVDTIELHLFDIKKHEHIYNSLRLITGGFRKFDGSETSKGRTIHSELLFYDTTDRSKEKYIYRTREVASSHYNVRFTADKYRNVIIFNFSIPKYFYGHNIAQAVKNSNEIDFSMFIESASYEYAVNNGYERLIRYVQTFFTNEFPGCPVDYRCLKLTRLDFCYNQIFSSKSAALNYLNMQKDLRKKHMRSGTVGVPYDTSVFYSNDDYSVKIYHKGTEYEKNDRKEHDKVNKRKGRTVFDTVYLQNTADCILRYEMTIRPGYMSYLYNSHLFRRKSSQFILWKNIFNKLKSLRKKNEKTYFSSDEAHNKTYRTIYEFYKNKKDKNSGLTVFEWLRNYYTGGRKFNEDFTMDSFVHIMNRFFDDFNTLITWRRSFFFKLGTVDMISNVSDNLDNDNKFNTVKECAFDSRMYKLMAGKLYEFINDMKVEQRKPTRYYLQKIDEYNSNIDARNSAKKGLPSFLHNKEKRISKPKMGLILAALENYQIHDLKGILGCDRKTIYNYQADLKKIGYTKGTVCYYDLQIPEITFSKYYTESMLNSYKMFNNQLFKLESVPKQLQNNK